MHPLNIDHIRVAPGDDRDQEAALVKLGQLYASQKDAAKLAEVVRSSRAFMSSTAKAKTAKLSTCPCCWLLLVLRLTSYSSPHPDRLFLSYTWVRIDAEASPRGQHRLGSSGEAYLPQAESRDAPCRTAPRHTSLSPCIKPYR